MRFVSPESFTFIESAMVLAMVVLGGMGSIPGVILGALALVALPEAFREFELYRMLAFGGAMAVMMLVRPAGLWPAARMGKRRVVAETGVRLLVSSVRINACLSARTTA